jgi:hypothetical protein
MNEIFAPCIFYGSRLKFHHNEKVFMNSGLPLVSHQGRESRRKNSHLSFGSVAAFHASSSPRKKINFANPPLFRSKTGKVISRVPGIFRAMKNESSKRQMKSLFDIKIVRGGVNNVLSAF